MADMHIIEDQIHSLYEAFAAGRDVLSGEAATLYEAARDRLLAANGITYADYLSWCESQSDDF